MMFVPIPAALGNVKAGTLRATSGIERQALERAARRADTGGIRRCPASTSRCATGWWRRPARHAAIIERLNKELNAALAADDVKSRLATEGADALPGTPEAYAADIDNEETKWGALVTQAWIKGRIARCRRAAIVCCSNPPITAL